MSDLDFVHRFLPAPSGAKSGRTLLLLHGTGGNENDLLDLGRAIDPAAALLSPRGKILENGAPRFFRRLAEGVFDEADVVVRAGELANFIKDAMEKYQIDPATMMAVGYSNGANIAAAMMLLGLAAFREGIFLRPMVPLSKIAAHDLKETRVFLSAGQFDPIARPQIVRQLAELLGKGGAEVTLELQESGHELTSADVDSARRWLAR